MIRSRLAVPALLAALLAPAGPALAQTVPAPPPPPAAPVPVAPQIQAQPRVITLGQSALITVDGAAGASVQLYAYTRPNTTYRLVRTGVLSRSGDFGRASWTITPPANTRLYARVDGRNTTTVTVNVAHTVTIGATNAAGTYRFTGVVRPGFTGLPVTLLRALPGGGATVVARTTTSPSGIWRIDRRFTGSGTFGFYAITGTSPDNVSGRSRTYGLAVSPPPRPATPRPAAPRPNQPAVPALPGDVDCGDFSTQRQAQAFHDRYHPYYGDFADLDGNEDGVACESLP